MIYLNVRCFELFLRSCLAYSRANKVHIIRQRIALSWLCLCANLGAVLAYLRAILSVRIKQMLTTRAVIAQELLVSFFVCSSIDRSF